MSEVLIKFHKVLTLPVTPVADSVYFVQNLPDALIDTYVTDSLGVAFQTKAGQSAYELAVELGFVGTEAEWIASLEGSPGPAGASFNHTQAIAASEWVVNHNLGFKPSVEILNSGGSEVDAEVLHMSINQVRIYFTMALAGSARFV